MKELTNTELQEVSGADCSWKGAGQAAVSGGIVGGIGGALSGAIAVPGIGSVPGWAGGAILGSFGGAAGYGATCWW